ncbi:hypothetical protein [Hyalangium versicolor]|uniref:hypothetical protein n=1 Tax=Hyalangium versicolor TaxID=2861190 RepID=UPI001CCFF27F|nr:hypothetical protein [Hyalangium versicolor]
MRWRAATEYCAWMYYTPDNKYEISLLTDQATPEPTGKAKHCILPSFVEDRRYPPESIQYIVVLHNHTFDNRISEDDVLYLVGQGNQHGFEPKTKDPERRLALVAFFSNGHENPTCDGFYAYTPYTGRFLKWTRNGKQWSCTQTHVVKWLSSDSLSAPTIKEEKARCPTVGAL